MRRFAIRSDREYSKELGVICLENKVGKRQDTVMSLEFEELPQEIFMTASKRPKRMAPGVLWSTK